MACGEGASPNTPVPVRARARCATLEPLRDGLGLGRRTLTEGKPFTFGREDVEYMDNELRPRYLAGMSKRQFSICYLPGSEPGSEFVLADTGSRNGTFINGDRVEAARRLKAGDTITIGDAATDFGFKFQPGEPLAVSTVVVDTAVGTFAAVPSPDRTTCAVSTIQMRFRTYQIQKRFRKDLLDKFERILHSDASANRRRVLRVVYGAERHRLHVIVRAVTADDAVMVKQFIDDKEFTVNDLDKFMSRSFLQSVSNTDPIWRPYKLYRSRDGKLNGTKQIPTQPSDVAPGLMSRSLLLLIACKLGHHEVAKVLLDSFFTLDKWQEAMAVAANPETVKVQICIVQSSELCPARAPFLSASRCGSPLQPPLLIITNPDGQS